MADWECVRATSYLYPDTPMTTAQAAGYQADGFELGAAPATPAARTSRRRRSRTTLDEPARRVRGGLAERRRRRCPTAPTASSGATGPREPKVERAHGIRFDTNYYYNGPARLADASPGLLTGSGFPQRFADLDGSMIDVYQAMTQVTDEIDDACRRRRRCDTLLDNALGPKDYYGVFTVITALATTATTRTLNDIVAAAQERGVPVVSLGPDARLARRPQRLVVRRHRLQRRPAQLLARPRTPKARGLEAMLPAQLGVRPAVAAARATASRSSWNARTVKGVDYVVFDGDGRRLRRHLRERHDRARRSPRVERHGRRRGPRDGHAGRPTSRRPRVVEYGRTTALGSRGDRHRAR